jgi:hypothetical protein
MFSCETVLNRNPDFFRKQTNSLGDGSDMSVFFIDIDSIISLKNIKTGYYFKSLIFLNEARETDGIIFSNNNCLFLRLKNALSDFKLIDFDLEIGSTESIKYTIITNKGDTVKKQFNMLIEDKFFDATLSDTIYQVRLEDFGINLSNDDIVLFVGKEVGLQGFYLGDIIYDENNTKIYYGRLGNIYQDRPYFKYLLLKKLQ